MTVQQRRIRRGPLGALLRTPGYSVPAALAMALGVAFGGPVLALAWGHRALPDPPSSLPAFDRAPGGGWTARLSAPELVQARGMDALVETALAAVLMLMAAAAVNLATLVLARATARRADTAVRAALGATPARLVRDAAADALALGTAGTVAGLLAGSAASLLLRATWPAPSGPLGAFRPWAGLGAAAAALLVPTVVLAAVPALAGARRHLHTWLAAGARATAGPGEVLLRKGLTILQFGAAVTLLCCALALVRGSLSPPDATALGFDPRDTLTFRVELPAGAADPARAQTNLLTALRGVPGVASASAATPGAWMGQGHSDWLHSLCDVCVSYFRVPILAGAARHHAVTPGYFAQMGVRVLSGREFTDSDGAAGGPVVVINRAFSVFMFPNANPLGHRVSFTGPFGTEYQVIGVVDDVRPRAPGSGGEPARAVYLSTLQHPPRTLAVAVRTSGEPMGMAPAVLGAARASVPGGRVSEVRSMAALLERNAAPLRWFGVLMAMVAAGSLLLSAGGLFAAMNFVVARRTREIGVRMALGASERAVIRQMLVEAGRVALFGALLGGAGALSLGRTLELRYAGVRALDLPVYAGVAAALALVAMAAAYVPARRAAGVQPVEALRGE